ncbi:MAG: MFS transporter [Candidatus Eremiobacteraeota bacterium]|nr:MFS transporter [Candidatus Eremiobacteraeota bacterium]
MKQQRALLLYANCGLFCDGYILSSIGLALVTLTPHFQLDALGTGALGGATLVGILAGAPIFGHYTDRFGRRILMIADLCVFVVACVAQAFCGALWQLVALRFVLGLAIGADYPIAAALIGESVGNRYRGAAVNSMQVAWFFGAAVAYALGYALLGAIGTQSWRWILASPALFAAIGLLLRSTAPESPLWIASRDSGALKRTPFRAMFSREHRGALAFVSAMWLLQVVPLFAIYAFAPVVLRALGLSDQRSPAGSLAITAAFLIGSIVSLPLVERWGRRPLCIAGFAIGTASFALLLAGNPQLVIVAFVAYAIGIGAAAGLELTYPVELFPTAIRASATGFAAAVSRIGAALGTFALPLVLDRYGVRSVVVASIALCAIGWIVALRWAPETRGTPLTA